MALVPSTYDISIDKNFIEIGQTYEDILKKDKNHLDASVFAKMPVNPTKAPGLGAGLKYRHDDGDSAQLKGSVHVDGTVQLSAGASKRIYTGKDRSVDVSSNVSVTVGFDGSIRDIDFGLPRVGF